MSKTKTVDYTGVGTAGKSKPLPRLPIMKKKSSGGLTMTSYASTPSKFYVSDQESFVDELPSTTRSAQGIFGFNSSFGRRRGDQTRSVDSQGQRHERPSRSLRINIGSRGRDGGGGVGERGGSGDGGGGGREVDTVEIYTPESDTRTPHLISNSKNTITYHSNFFEEPHLREGADGELEGRGLGQDDPLEIEELELGVAAFEVRSSAGVALDDARATAITTSTPVVRGALSPVDLDSGSSDFYQHHQYQQQRHRYSQRHHHQPPLPLPSHRNRSQRSYDGITSPGGRAAAGGSARDRAKSVQLGYYDIEGSWAFDASGRPYFRPTGKIEEIREVEEGVEMQEGPALSTRKRSLESAGLDSQNRLTTFHTPPQDSIEVTSPLPPTTTPPPRPRRVEEVVLSPGGTNFSIPKTVLNSTPGLSDIGVGRGNGNLSAHHRRVGLDVQMDLPMDLDIPQVVLDTPPAPPPAALPAPPALSNPGPEAHQESEELDLETQSLLLMLKHVETGVKDVLFLRDYFIRMCAVYFLRNHIDATYRVEAALLDVQEAIDRRRNIPQSHLDIRTAEWQEKFEVRLVSVRTTVQRLIALREFVEKRKKLTEQHLEELFQRLLAHEMKYADIATKLHASYERLKLRHMHTQLESAYKAGVEARNERKVRKRKSFRRKRAEAKAERAGLRSEFNRERGPAVV